MPNNQMTPSNPLKEPCGDSRKEKLVFNRKKPLADTGSWRGNNLLKPAVRGKRKEKRHSQR